MGRGEDPARPARLFVARLDGSAPRPLDVPGIRSFSSGVAPSPDGRSVAAVDPAGRLVIVPLAGGEARHVAGSVEDESPVGFSPDGASLYVFGRGEAPAPVTRIDLASGKREVVRTLMPSDPAGVDRIRNVRMTPDGTSWAYTAYRTLSVLYVADGIR